MKITLAVTAYNEKQRALGEWVARCVSVAIDHPLVSDVVIVNDASDDIDFLCETFSGKSKVRIIQNQINLGVFGNKVQSVQESREPWVVMCDSDNFMGVDYFNRLMGICPWSIDHLYCPSFGRPKLNYTHLCGVYSMKGFVGLRGKRLFGCLFNTGNQFVHRQSFLDVFGGYRRDRFDLEQPNYFAVEDREDKRWRIIHDAADSAWINTCWLKQGYSLRVVDGLHYVHNCTPQSYCRAPQEKRALHPVYLCEMQDLLDHGSVRSYKFLRKDTHQGQSRWVYEVNGSSLLGVWGWNHENIETITE